MKNLLTRLTQFQKITKQEAKDVLVSISKGKFSQVEIAAFLTVYMMRNISIEELDGFREALLELCISVDLSDYNPIDLCGTGGDGKNTFNISTAASFVTASCGIPVAKHGNYGVSSVSGSSNVLESLGVKFSNDEAFLKKCMDKAQICILHAPLFHPAMKEVAPIRKNLGLKTFFNMLGPMVNPSFPKLQLVGVFNLELLRTYAYLYEQTDKKYSIIHELDGYDEVSLTSSAKVHTHQSELMISAETFDVKALQQNELFGGNTVKEAAAIFVKVLQGKGTTAQNHVVAANAALAIHTTTNKPLKTCFDMALQNLLEGKAFQVLEQLKSVA
ncbi:anthranilate phosphoribosyltransferase [Psychroflexus planctonicus]|uniref:Anthranilate phosphoribosyltransferase n=1 Tax=Psychroflexus planctonicus TaxID=1526575 RepID=A0ABQ1SJB1_9FLAO|nr:anthranilate phosphoribosyltransferase [Psychroflexus planctonicus]GGE36730.1 anthranilate phosphoribosyltransferase [Psychroflexus planctonicus]